MLKNLSPFSRLILEIYKLSEVTPASEFQQKSLEKLNEYLPFDSGMWGTGLVQPDGLKIITLHLHNTTTEMIAAYQSVKHEDLAVVELAKHRSKTIGYNALELFKGSDSMTEFINKFQHRNIFISCQNNHDTKFTEWISLYRSKNEQLCTKKKLIF